MIRNFYSAVRTCLFLFFILFGWGGPAQAESPLLTSKPVSTTVPEEQQRYLMYVFTNTGYYNDPNFNWSTIETAIKNGCNSVELCVPWDEVVPTRNGPANWATLDKQIDRIIQLGAKVALRIGLHRDVDRLDTFWSEENGMRTYKKEILYKNHAYQFSPAYQPTVDLASDFVRQVAQRYSNRQQQGNILFMSVTTTSFLELEYSATNMIRYEAGEFSTVADYSPAMITGFRAWLAAKYTTVAKLNAAWTNNFLRFDQVQPPGLSGGSIYEAFYGKPGKDWYAYRHKVHKSLIDQTTQAIKSVNSGYKVINQHGSVFDDYSVFRGTLGFKNYAQTTDGVKVNDSPYFLHRFSMDVIRSNVAPGKWVMNEVDGQGYARIGADVFVDQVTQCFQHGAKAIALANFSDATGLEYVRQIVQRVRAQGWMDQPVPAFAPVGNVPVKLSKLVESGYSQLGVPSQWLQIYNQNGNQPVRITIDEDILDSTIVTSPPTSTTAAPVTPVSSLSLLPPTVDCATGLLTFKTAGGDGTPIEYFAVGLLPWSTTATVTLSPLQRIGVTFTLKARQSGNEVSYDYTTTCPANKPPVLVTPIASQTVTLTKAFTYVIPATTFMDPDGQIVSWAVSNLPWGLMFDPATRTISGTPTGIGTYSVTLVVTDNDGATAQTTFNLKAIGTAKPITPPTTPPTTPVSSLSLLAPTVDCVTNILTFRTAGGDSTTIEYSAAGLQAWSTSPTVKLDPTQKQGVFFMLKARQSGREVSYDYTTDCANQAPIVANMIPTQLLTQGVAYSFVIPTTAFTDPDGEIISWAVTSLPLGLTYSAATRTISGTPGTVGTTLAQLTVTDNRGATARQDIAFAVVSPPAAPAPSILLMVAPGYDCVTGKLVFRTTGGDGTPIEYFAVGIKSWSRDSVAILDPIFRTGISFTLQARQSGKQASYAFTSGCPTVVVNKPPVLVTAIASQTATLNRAYSFTIPAATFSDPEGLPLTWAVSNLPVGLTFDATTQLISGTPSLIGPNVVTVVVTDNAGATVQTTFVLQVLGNNTTVPRVMALTMVAPGYDCVTGKLVFRTTGGDGTPIEYFAVGIKLWNRDSTATLDSWMRTGISFTLQARQSGKQASYAFTSGCPTVVVNKPPVLVTAIASQIATLNRAYNFTIPAATFSDPEGLPLTWAASNLPVGLTFDATTHLISGTPSLIGPNVVTVVVTDNAGATVQTTFVLQVLGNNTTVPQVMALTIVAPGYDCVTGKLVFRTTGGDGTPIEYFAVGIKSWSRDSVAILDPIFRTGISFTLQARQSGKQASYAFTSGCPTVVVNKPPVLVTAIASQTATLNRAYSFTIPAATFSDPEGLPLTWAVSNLPVGLTFDATTQLISGTPSLIGPNVVTVVVTDNAGATVQTTFVLQVLGNNTTPTPTPTLPVSTSLTMLLPNVDCTTGKFTFRTRGGDGTPIEYFAVGLKPWGLDSTAVLDPIFRNGINLTLRARQSGKEIALAYVTACSSLTVTTPPSATTAITPTITTLSIVSPQNRIVYQRNQANQAVIPVVGQAPGTATRSEARLVPVVAGQGTPLDWTDMPLSATKTFATALTHVGGWYRLEVRVWNGSTPLGGQTVDRVGIGEVFIIAGQSNAYGGFDIRPGASDDRVSSVNYKDNNLVEALLPVQFSHMDAGVSAGPNNPMHIWPELGDKLASRLNVPILFLGAAQSSTTSDMWRQSMEGAASYQPDLFPYRRLGATLLHYIARTGARAVLWHQGEGDQGYGEQNYVNNLTAIINKSRQQSGNSTLPWVVSRASYVMGITDPLIINAQNRLTRELNQVYPGPETDALGAAYRLADNVHIAGIGGTRFIEMWDQSLNSDFFNRSAPFIVGNSPQITTGYVLAGTHLAGQTIQVPYVVSGTADATGTFSVQLLRDSDGSVVATLGSGRTNPMTVTLPGTLANGTYRAKVVSGTLTAQAGEPFRVGPLGGRIAAPETPATGWLAWPNPVERELAVTVPATVTTAKLRVVLSNISGLNQPGAIESTRAEEGQLHLTLPALQTGMYFLHIYDGDKPLQTLKIFKK